MHSGEVHQSLGKFTRCIAKLDGKLPHPEPQSGLDLVVAAPPCMDFLSCLTDMFGQIRLDGGMAILIFLGNREGILDPERDNLCQRLLQAGELFIGKKADEVESAGMGDGSQGISNYQLLIE